MEHSKPSTSTGGLVGGLITAAETALFFLGGMLFGWPVIPFDLFDWIARVLPGGIVTIGIDTLVRVLSTLGLSVRENAKTAESLMAVGIYLVLGIAAGAAFFAIQNRREPSSDEPSFWPGVVMGFIVGVPLLLISISMSSGNINFIGVIWAALLILAWGGVIGWAYGRLRDMSLEPAADDLTTEQIDRRRFLIRLGAATAVITVVGAGVGLAASKRPARENNTISEAGSNDNSGPPNTMEGGPLNPEDLPNADDPIKPAPGTRSEYTPVDQHYRTDIDIWPPEIEERTWYVQIKGLVDNPLTLTLENIKSYPAQDIFITLACISNQVGGDLIGTTRWTGTPFKKILEDAKLKPEAKFLRITSEDGFYETVDLETILNDERIMLAYAWDGAPLTAEHGFPVRIYIPDLYGMKQPKWVAEMEVMDHYEPGYWVVRGWDEIAQMKITSVIDTVAKQAKFDDNGKQLVPIGGIAHAGARRISKVEVKVDDGDWVETQLRKPLSDLTWVIWRYDWPFQSGRHTFYVRATDGNGELQSTEIDPPHPSGASGIHSVEEDF